MIEYAERQACGNCGNKDFAVYKAKEQFMPTRFIVECLACKSTTIIRAKPADLEVDWGDNNEGILCTLR